MGRDGEIVQLIPSGSKSLERNTLELLEEIRNGNVKCLFLTYMREDGSQRTYRYGVEEDKTWYNWMLDVAKSDIMMDEEAREPIDYSDEGE